MTSLSLNPSVACAYSAAVSMRLECTCTAPLGVPVDPDEYSQKQGSSRKVAAGSNESVDAARISLKAYRPVGGAVVPDIKTYFRKGDWPNIGRNCGSSGSESTAMAARLSLSIWASSAG